MDTTGRPLCGAAVAALKKGGLCPEEGSGGGRMPTQDDITGLGGGSNVCRAGMTIGFGPSGR